MKIDEVATCYSCSQRNHDGQYQSDLEIMCPLDEVGGFAQEPTLYN